MKITADILEQVLHLIDPKKKMEDYPCANCDNSDDVDEWCKTVGNDTTVAVLDKLLKHNDIEPPRSRSSKASKILLLVKALVETSE